MELWREFAAYRARQQDDQQRDVVLAWTIAKFAWAKHPDQLLQQLLRARATAATAEGPTGSSHQTMPQMRATLHLLSEQFGIPLRRGGKRV